MAVIIYLNKNYQTDDVPTNDYYNSIIISKMYYIIMYKFDVVVRCYMLRDFN